MADSRAFRFDNLVLDAGRRTVLRGTQVISMTGKSFDLLEALVRAAPDSLSTEELMERVWKGAVVSPATIAKRVELLRQALGDDSQEPRYVALVRGYGYRLVPEVVDAERPRTVHRRALGAASTVAVLLLIAVVGWQTQRPVQLPPDRTIAVLPFVSLSPDSDDQIFADGLTEELGHILASGGELQVAGRNSSFQFKDRQQDVRSIGEQLGVAHVLRGSVRHANGRIRITAQLVDTRNGFDVWSSSFDRQFADIIQIQQDIAQNVASRLQTTFIAAHRGGMVDPEAIGAEAYAVYLRAVSLSPYGKNRGLEEAQRLTERVTELAPEFAPGWNRLAAIHGRRLFGADPGYPFTLDEALPIIYGAVARAMTLDPDNAETFANLGGAAWVFEGDARKAAPLIERAVQLAPWDLDIVSFAAEFALYLGRVDQALGPLELRVARDPLCELCRRRLVGAYMYAGRLTDAEHQLGILDSMSGGYLWERGMVLLLTGRPREAQRVLDDIADPAIRQMGRVLVSCAAGQGGADRQSLSALEQELGETYSQGVARAFAFCGFHDEAFDWLERSLPEGTLQLQLEFLDPLYDGLRKDPRWAAILQRIDRSPEQTDSIPFSLDVPL